MILVFHLINNQDYLLINIRNDINNQDYYIRRYYIKLIYYINIFILTYYIKLMI